MKQSMMMKTKRSIKSVQTMLQLLVLLSTMSLGMSSHAQTGNLTVSRTPSTMIAGQPFTIAWSSTEPTAVATKYSCVSPAGGFAGSATLSVSGSASGTADPNWLWKDSTCTWTVVNATGSILASRTDIMKTVAASVTGVTYIHTDGLGSPVAKSDANGNLIAGSRTRYEPYGMTVAGTATPTIGFTGHVNDADTGLTYMQQRYYDPVAGRFLSTDPVLTDNNSGASFNRYTYANNNPYNYIDPDGRQATRSIISLPVVGQTGSGSRNKLDPDDDLNSRPTPARRPLLSSTQQLVLMSTCGLPCILSSIIMASAETSGANSVEDIKGDKDPSTPTGQRGSPLDVKHGTNTPTTIGGRDYGGHALDQMQGRGVPPSAVEDAIKNGSQKPGNKPDRVVNTSQDGRLVVITEGGKVITVIPK